MLIQDKHKNSLEEFFNKIKLGKEDNFRGRDRENKIQQILSYLEIIHSKLRKYSKKRTLVIIDFAAGNCYLSFLIYYFYTVIHDYKVEIHCVDNNRKLMDNAEKRAEELGFLNMNFHSLDILDFSIDKPVDLSCSLHACDIATDKALYMGLRLKSKTILSVSCCQHSIKKDFSNQVLKGFKGHKIFNQKLMYMAADAMRALLVEKEGYRVDIFEFTSSHYTDKNTMVRAQFNNHRPKENLWLKYISLKHDFRITPYLEELLSLAEKQNSVALIG